MLRLRFSPAGWLSFTADHELNTVGYTITNHDDLSWMIRAGSGPEGTPPR